MDPLFAWANWGKDNIVVGNVQWVYTINMDGALRSILHNFYYENDLNMSTYIMAAGKKCASKVCGQTRCLYKIIARPR